jgi:hypothetical protein
LKDDYIDKVINAAINESFAMYNIDETKAIVIDIGAKYAPYLEVDKISNSILV